MVGRFGAAVVALAGAWGVAAGCAANGSQMQVNGPEYDLEAGVEGGFIADATTPGDGAPSLDGDSSPATTSNDGAAPVEGSPGTDANAPDANDGGGGALEDAGCTATTAVVGGNDFALFGATATGTGAFTTTALAGSLAGTPAIVPFGSGFQALFMEAVDAGGAAALYGVGYSGSAWGTPSALGGGAASIAPPALGVVGSTLQAVYLNAQHFYYQATYATSWNTGNAPVQPPNDAGSIAFGPAGAAAAGTATQLVVAYEGNDLLPYAQTWTSGAGWDDGVALGSVDVAANTPMAIAALDSGTYDLVAVYVDGEGSGSPYNTHLFYVLRTASSKAWSSPVEISSTVYTPSAPTLATLSGGRAIVTWLGFGGGAYASVFTSGASTPWSAASEITASTLSVAPSVAAGVCGDDAEGAYIYDDNVYTTHFASGAWSSGAALSGGAGATAAAIATSP